MNERPQPRKGIFHNAGAAIREAGRRADAQRTSEGLKRQSSRITEGRTLRTAKKLTFREFLEHAKNLGKELGGDHSFHIEFEQQTGGVLGRFILAHKKPLSADQSNALDDAAHGAGMSGFRLQHDASKHRNGVLTIVFDATKKDEILKDFLAVHPENTRVEYEDEKKTIMAELAARYHAD